MKAYINFFTGENVYNDIPVMNNLIGSWSQPHLSDIDFTDDGYAVINKYAFDKLSEYSATLPTGMYPGRMWKEQMGDAWLLGWCGIMIRDAIEDTTKCSINYRPIILKEMLDLLENR